jgi:gliding motility-associated-like protein
MRLPASLRHCATIVLLLSSFSAFAQFDAGPNDTVNPGVPVTLTATYGQVGIGVTLGDDDIAGPFPIGFNFNFFGTNYSEFWIGANGWIAFSPNPNAAGTRQAFAVPNAGDKVPKNCILGPFQDLLPKQAGGPYVYYLTIDTVPHRKLVVMFCQTPMYSCTEFVTFQVVLFEGTNTIESQIFHKPYCDWLGNLGTLGVQNSSGYEGYAVPGKNGTSWTADTVGWRYTPTSADSFQIAQVPYHLQSILPGDKVSYRWYQGTDEIGTTQSITVTPNETSKYRAYIRLCDGQEFTDSVIVAVMPYIPNAFTPNGDGLNDIFRIYGVQPESIIFFNFMIYDRWGQMVFHSNDILQGWDGKMNGQYCSPGVYPWVVYWEDGKKTRVTRKGVVTLVR